MITSQFPAQQAPDSYYRPPGSQKSADMTTIKVALLEKELEMLRESQKESISRLSKDVRELVDIMNRGKGAFGFAMILAGGMGAALVSLIQMFGKQG